METFQPKLILCATDFREPATLGLHYAKHLASCFNARLLVLYAEPFSPPLFFTSGQVEEFAKEMERCKSAAREYLDRYVKEHLGDSPRIEETIVQNEAVPAILKTLEGRRVDLVVMGTHSHSDLSRLLVGSVTEEILHRTDLPVLTVRDKNVLAEPFKVRTRQILCPVNFTEVSSKALEHAAALSKCFNAELLVLHVIESRAPDITEQGEHARLCSWIPGEARRQCNVKEFIRRGDAAEEIIRMASDAASDMIVLGAQHRPFYDRTILGTTTVRVTRHAACPVLTVIRR